MENIGDIHSQSNIRSHVALAVVTLILAIILLVLVFVPRPVRTITAPNGQQYQTVPGSGGGQVSPSNSQGYTGTGTSAIVSGFVIPPLAL